MKPQPNFFSLALSKYCDEKGITQENLARRLDVTTHTVSNWIRGRNSPSAQKMQRIADELGIDFHCKPSGNE